MRLAHLCRTFLDMSYQKVNFTARNVIGTLLPLLGWIHSKCSVWNQSWGLRPRPISIAFIFAAWLITVAKGTREPKHGEITPNDIHLINEPSPVLSTMNQGKMKFLPTAPSKCRNSCNLD